jgi:ABC-type thiamin/hydroxymethylpyrimidine transport system permease subunit
MRATALMLPPRQLSLADAIFRWLMIAIISDADISLARSGASCASAGAARQQRAAQRSSAAAAAMLRSVCAAICAQAQVAQKKKKSRHDIDIATASFFFSPISFSFDYFFHISAFTSFFILLPCHC